MKTVWKFPIEVVDEQQVSMPFGAEILCAQVQGGLPYLWALVTDGNSPEPVKILVRGTGHEIGSGITREDYIGTFQLCNGGLVFHVFQA